MDTIIVTGSKNGLKGQVEIEGRRMRSAFIGSNSSSKSRANQIDSGSYFV